ncbi:hypothetical protein B932_3277 [Gluconobacter oxydans H24]|uniref:hypothetical protein n=1 Tax=Gluconobacter thailandicus TaxID=257438 RepID=UPI0002995EE2|nr:hypothetical protein [Gluconobacter thailandicus]AFW02822.1 hypothetical protein B932_3277 [Gluconobacter oxydans H24]
MCHPTPGIERERLIQHGDGLIHILDPPSEPVQTLRQRLDPLQQARLEIHVHLLPSGHRHAPDLEVR